MLFPRVATLCLLLAWAVTGTVFACPFCRIENHLHTAVASAEHLAVVKVLKKHGEDEWLAEVQKVIKKGTTVGHRMEYEDRFRIGRPGEVMLAIGRSMSPEAASNDLLPLDLLPEIQRLLQPDPQPADADEAAEYLTSVSFMLHSAGGSYYKARPSEVQEALIRRIHQLETATGSPSSPYYVRQQLRCGLTALLRIRTALSDARVVREIEAFRQISQQPSTPEALFLAMERLETVLSVLADQPPDDRRKHVTDLLASAQGQTLSRVAQCLIVSDLMSPEDILRERPGTKDAEWIKQAVVLAGILHSKVWDPKTAAVLAQTAKKIPGSIADTELAALTTALETDKHYIPSSSAQPWETPSDAGWFSYSPLFDAATWDKVPVRAPAESFMSLEIIILGVAAAFLLSLFARLYWKFRAAQPD